MQKRKRFGANEVIEVAGLAQHNRGRSGGNQERKGLLLCRVNIQLLRLVSRTKSRVSRDPSNAKKKFGMDLRGQGRQPTGFGRRGWVNSQGNDVLVECAEQ